jgi:hypothetical protein
MAEITEGGAGQSSGSIFLRKTGPLANWIWMAILLLAALVYSLWKRNAAGAGGEAEELDGPVVEEYPGNSTPPPVFILPQNPQPTVPVNVVVNNPGTPPTAPPVATKPPVTVPKPKPSAPSKPAVAYDAVKVSKYTSKNPPWNSTLWGIAKHAGYGSASKNWTTIWNDPKNAALKKKRGTPEKIQPNDVIYVRRK